MMVLLDDLAATDGDLTQPRDNPLIVKDCAWILDVSKQMIEPGGPVIEQGT